jgi:hypothetical protein
MGDEPKLTRWQVDGIRANVLAFLKQENDDTCIMMPMMPKRLLIMCNTIDQLYDQLESSS